MTRKGILVTGLAVLMALSAHAAVPMSLPGMTVQLALQSLTVTQLLKVAKVESAATPATGAFEEGERVVLIDSDPPGGQGLEAGRSGTVICCDTNDCSGNILVSWDFWANSKADTSGCASKISVLYPANSLVWIDPNQTRIGHLFKMCGTLRKGLEGCVYLEAFDGHIYNVISVDGLYAALNESTNTIRFDAQVQVQGLLNTTPPAPSEIRLCPQLDGDIYHPIVTACPDTGSQGSPSPINISLGGSSLQLIPNPNSPGPGYTYDGCTNITIQLNFQAQLSVKVTPAAGVDGVWTGSVTPSIVGPGTVMVQVCVHVEHLDPSTLPPGNTQIATVTLLAAPSP
jgi:hypothetical protein